MSVLIVGGCSFTTANYKSRWHPEMDCSWKKWPEIIEGDWNKVINTAKSGASNDKILNDVLEAVLDNDDVSTVIIAFTNWMRFTMPDGFMHNPSWVHHNNSYKNEGIISPLYHLYERMKRYEEKLPTNSDTITRLISTNLLTLYALIRLCLLRDIKFIGFQMLDFAGSNNPVLDNTAQSVMIKNKHFNKIDKLIVEDKIDMINWPFVNNLSSCIEKVIRERLKQSDKYRISARDAHPNSLGQQFIANWIMENATLL